jgi:ATP-dependent Clp protease ATP-binding subunit ClpX
MIPEIIGRMPVIAPLDALGVDDLARILAQPKDSLVAQFRASPRSGAREPGA